MQSSSTHLPWSHSSELSRKDSSDTVLQLTVEIANLRNCRHRNAGLKMRKNERWNRKKHDYKLPITVDRWNVSWAGCNDSTICKLRRNAFYLERFFAWQLFVINMKPTVASTYGAIKPRNREILNELFVHTYLCCFPLSLLLSIRAIRGNRCSQSNVRFWIASHHWQRGVRRTPPTVASLHQNLGGVDPTGDRSYPPWNHPPTPGDTGCLQ